MKRSPLIILFITVVIDLLGFGIILPLLPLYVKEFGGTPVVAGWLSTCFSIMQFLFAPVWGRASDLWGRRPLILLSLCGSAVSFFLFGIAGSLWMLFVARIAAGVMTAASLPTSQAYIADVTPPEKRARGMAMIGVAFGIGFAFGPWIGGQLGKYGLGVPAFFVAGMALANLVWSFFALPETHVTDRDTAHARTIVFFDLSRFTRALRSVTLGELLTVFCGSTFAFALMEATFTWLVLYRFVGPQYHVQMSEPNLNQTMLEVLSKKAAATVSPIFGIVGVTIFFVQGAMMSGLAQRFGERRLVRLGALLLAAALFALGSAASLTLLKLFSACLAIGSGILNPSLSSLISQVAGPDERGGVLGIQQGLGSFARIIAPPLGTWLLQRISTGTPYYVAGGLMGVAFLLSLNLKSLPVADSTSPPSFEH